MCEEEDRASSKLARKTVWDSGQSRRMKEFGMKLEFIVVG